MLVLQGGTSPIPLLKLQQVDCCQVELRSLINFCTSSQITAIAHIAASKVSKQSACFGIELSFSLLWASARQ